VASCSASTKSVKQAERPLNNEDGGALRFMSEFGSSLTAWITKMKETDWKTMKPYALLFVIKSTRYTSSFARSSLFALCR